MTPEPPEPDREAILAALAAATAEERRGLDPWAAAALQEATGNHPDSSCVSKVENRPFNEEHVCPLR